jgi:hypothetical protein
MPVRLVSRPRHNTTQRALTLRVMLVDRPVASYALTPSCSTAPVGYVANMDALATDNSPKDAALMVNRVLTLASDSAEPKVAFAEKKAYVTCSTHTRMRTRGRVASQSKGILPPQLLMEGACSSL